MLVSALQKPLPTNATLSQSGTKKDNDIPYARHFKPWLVYFYPRFEDNFFVFKEIFSENSVLMYGWYSRVVFNQERFMMVHGIINVINSKQENKSKTRT
jgi:hypothetical protein